MAELAFGEFVRSVDERFRVSVPAQLAQSLIGDRPQCVLVKERVGALSLWAAEVWMERYEASLHVLQARWQSGALSTQRESMQQLGRLLSTRHQAVSLRGRTRLLIPEGFREFLGIRPGEPLVVVGAAICIEFWRPDAWHSHLEEELPGFPRMWEEMVN